VLLTLTLGCGLANTLCAQTAASTWEVAFQVGTGTVSNLPGGTASPPPADPLFTTVVGTPSLKTSSWYFGDGAVLLNQVNAALGAAAAITPLDPVFARSFVDDQRGTSVGVRVSRRLSRRFSAELAFEHGVIRLRMDPAVIPIVEAARASFVPAWTAVIANGPFVSANVTSESALHDGRGRQSLTTGALNINLRTSGKLVPYATAGAGFLVTTGEAPSASLTGHYQFQTLDQIPVNETDTVRLRSSVDNGPVFVVGGGLRYFVSPRWGIRVDIRGLFNRVTTTTFVDATPSVMSASPSAPAIVAASLTTPAVQFSNNVIFGPSSLARPLNDFRGFEGSGVQKQVNTTAGVFFRF
jgi:hypothetical protein